MSLVARGLAHECRTEATRLRHTDLRQVTVDRDAIAGLLERCATSLEEMDATVPAVREIQDKAVRVYQRAGRVQGPMSPPETVNLAMSQDLAATVIDLCSYLQREKAHA